MVVLNNKVKSELQAWIDKYWYAETKKRLSEWGVLDSLREQAQTQANSTLTGAKGYNETQVWIPWVNMVSTPNSTLNTNTSWTWTGWNTWDEDPFKVYKDQIAKLTEAWKQKDTLYENLYNKWASAELAGWVSQLSTDTWNAWLDLLSTTASDLKINLDNEIEAFNQQKAWLWTALTDTWKLTAEEQTDVLQPYDQFLDKVTKLQDINKQASQREQESLKRNYSQTIDRQRKANEIALTNAQKIAAITGVWFTSWWIQGIGNIMEESNQAITDLEQNREDMLSKYKDYDNKLDIEYLDTITTIQKESKQALQDRYNSVITQIQQIDADKWKATKEWLTAIKDVVKEYFDVLDSQWNKDYKMMEFNYNQFVNYKKDLREDEKIVREQQQSDLELLKEWNLTTLTDEDITTLWSDLDLDKWAIQWLILLREEQKRKNKIEADKFALETKKANEMTPAQKAQYNLDVEKFWLEKAKFNLEKWKTWTGLTVTEWTTTNRPDRNNNPWNIKAWDVWYWVDDQNHTIFWSASEWYDAMVKDVTAKLEWRSRWGLTPESTLAQLWKIYAEDPKWANSVASLSWYNTNTKLKDIDVNKLAPAIAKQEWFTWKITQWVKEEWKYSELVKWLVGWVWELSDFTATEKWKILPELQAYIKTLETDDADRNRIIRSSLNKKNPSETSLTKIQDMQTVRFQLDNLEDRLSDIKTWPILWKLKKLNPYDTEAQVAMAQLAWLTPKVARWIFWEVWVLTDTDIANYQKALPNLTSTEDKNKLVIGFMRKLLSEWYKNAIVTQSKGWVNMSEFLPDYDAMKSMQEQTWTSTNQTSIKTTTTWWRVTKTWWRIK